MICYSLPYFYNGNVLTHTREKPFKCNQYDPLFTTLILIKDHDRTHKGEKPFECNQCDPLFTTLFLIKDHE